MSWIIIIFCTIVGAVMGGAIGYKKSKQRQKQIRQQMNMQRPTEPIQPNDTDSK